MPTRQVICSAVLARKEMDDAAAEMHASTARQQRLVESMHRASLGEARASRQCAAGLPASRLQDAIWGPDTSAAPAPQSRGFFFLLSRATVVGAS